MEHPVAIKRTISSSPSPAPTDLELVLDLLWDLHLGAVRHAPVDLVDEDAGADGVGHRPEGGPLPLPDDRL